jgi:hypothetical protein
VNTGRFRTARRAKRVADSLSCVEEELMLDATSSGIRSLLRATAASIPPRFAVEIAPDRPAASLAAIAIVRGSRDAGRRDTA